MIARMPCQLCGCAHQAENEKSFSIYFLVCCGDPCWLSIGSKISWDDASRQWNELQALIARGILLDQGMDNKPAKGRL